MIVYTSSHCGFKVTGDAAKAGGNVQMCVVYYVSGSGVMGNDADHFLGRIAVTDGCRFADYSNLSDGVGADGS